MVSMTPVPRPGESAVPGEFPCVGESWHFETQAHEESAVLNEIGGIGHAVASHVRAMGIWGSGHQ